MSNYQNKPKISIILPVYNAARFLRESLDSILDQTFSDFEVIAVDDGSVDGSPYILKQYQKRDKRLRVYYNAKNQGVSRTANKAIKLAQGDYIARMDADDVMIKNRLQLQYEFLKNNPEYVLVGGQVRLIDEDGNHKRIKNFPLNHKEIKSMMYLACPVQQATIMVNRSKLPEDFVWYENGMNTAEEVELLFKLLNYGKFKNLKQIVHDYRQHPGSLSHQNPKDTFSLTYIARRKGVKLHNYKASLKDTIILELQKILVNVLPKDLIYPVYFKLRRLIVLISKISGIQTNEIKNLQQNKKLLTQH
jgi:glycosyltransferase involved in cell wall biosynthesis